jgi:NAD(P) transhydrogenase subunit alpha
MRIGVPKETAPGERRVALAPESCKKLRQAGYEIALESGAGEAASFCPAAPPWRRRISFLNQITSA